MANLKNVIYLSNEDYETLVSTGTVTIDGTTLTYDENNVYVTPDKLASSTEDGLMSSSDKVKLDSIESGAQVNPSAYLKNASVSSNTLTITKQDDTTVTFSASGDNQKVKAGSVTFGDNDVVDIVGGSNVTVTGLASGTGAPKITIDATDTTYNLVSKSKSVGTEIPYLEDVTLTGASASGTATFIKTINGGSGTFTPTTKYLHKSTGTFVTGVSGGSGSFTPTTKYLNASYTAGTAVTSGTTKYIHFSQGSLPSSSSESVASGSFTTEASMNFNTQNTSDAPYVASITSNSATGTPTTRYLHPSTTSVITGISTEADDVASGTHTHSVTATGTVSLGSNTTSEGGVAYIASLSTSSYTPQGSVTLSGDNFSKTSVVTGVTSDGTSSVVTGISSGSMIGTRGTSGSGATARRTLSISYTSASASGTATALTGVKASGTTNAYTGISATKPTFSGTAATVATGGTTKYFHPSFTGTSATSGTPSATTNVLTSASSSGTANAITGLSANTTSASGDITYLQSYSVSGGGASATTKYMKFTKPVLGTKNISTLSSAGSLPTLTINSTSEGGNAFIESVNSGSVGGSVSLTNTGSSGIQYMESATHTHTAASASGTSSAITNIEASSTNNTGDITYLESATHTHIGASVATSGDAVTGINGGSISKTTKYLELEEEN